VEQVRQQLRAGFVGLGVMGHPMAANLLQAGFPLAVATRSPEKAADLVANGAALHASPAEVASVSDVIVTMVPDSADVIDVVTGEVGLLSGARRGLTWIDTSSISPTVTRRLADLARESGVDSLDAPVSGGEKAAMAGSLSIMVGGAERVLDRCRPVLECLGASVVHVGATGAGQVAKICNQVIVGCNIAAVAEALSLARRSGVDPAKVREAIWGGFAGSRVLDEHGARMLEHRFEPGFRSRLHRKDLANAMDLARATDSLALLSAVVVQILNGQCAVGAGGLDHSALVQFYEKGI